MPSRYEASKMTRRSTVAYITPKRSTSQCLGPYSAPSSPIPTRHSEDLTTTRSSCLLPRRFSGKATLSGRSIFGGNQSLIGNQLDD